MTSRDVTVDLERIVASLRAEQWALREMTENATPFELSYLIRHHWRPRSAPAYAVEGTLLQQGERLKRIVDKDGPRWQAPVQVPPLRVQGVAIGIYPDGSSRRPKRSPQCDASDVDLVKKKRGLIDVDAALFNLYNLRRIQSECKAIEQQRTAPLNVAATSVTEAALRLLRKQQALIEKALSRRQQHKDSA
ncbi:Uncharacterized protein PBTT_01232 [Plasmodiophora brassicae]|uniref:Uncharacterized protein n=1 Tax=Plasmodiophora brassicae TaxID=37360 RepID=A0A0G4IZ18_PLABS|nr:hypothetical protein PBRA_001566 [Plasmodiophora brassicae]